MWTEKKKNNNKTEENSFDVIKSKLEQWSRIQKSVKIEFISVSLYIRMSINEENNKFNSPHNAYKRIRG